MPADMVKQVFLKRKIVRQDKIHISFYEIKISQMNQRWRLVRLGVKVALLCSVEKRGESTQNYTKLPRNLFRSSSIQTKRFRT